DLPGFQCRASTWSTRDDDSAKGQRRASGRTVWNRKTQPRRQTATLYQRLLNWTHGESHLHEYRAVQRGPGSARKLDTRVRRGTSRRVILISPPPKSPATACEARRRLLCDIKYIALQHGVSHLA